MNGRITIEIGGVKTPLTFGMLAIEELSIRQAIGSSGWSKLMIDLVYSGYINEETVEGRNPALSYRDISESMDDLISTQSPVLGEIFKCFEDSKAGKHLTETVKKKLGESLPKSVATKKKRTGPKSKDLHSES